LQGCDRAAQGSRLIASFLGRSVLREGGGNRGQEESKDN